MMSGVLSGMYLSSPYTGASLRYRILIRVPILSLNAASAALTRLKEISMLNYIVTFFLLAVVAAFFGFGGLAADFASIAKFLAGVFVLLFIASLIYSLVTGPKLNTPL